MFNAPTFERNGRTNHITHLLCNRLSCRRLIPYLMTNWITGPITPIEVSGVEMYAHIKVVSALSIVEIYNPFQVLILIVTHIVVVSSNGSPHLAKLRSRFVNYSTSLVNLIQTPRRGACCTTNVLSMT